MERLYPVYHTERDCEYGKQLLSRTMDLLSSPEHDHLPQDALSGEPCYLLPSALSLEIKGRELTLAATINQSSAPNDLERQSREYIRRIQDKLVMTTNGIDTAHVTGCKFSLIPIPSRSYHQEAPMGRTLRYNVEQPWVSLCFFCSLGFIFSPRFPLIFHILSAFDPA